MGAARDQAHGLDKGFPRLALAREHAATLGCQRIETPAALAGLPDPATLQPLALFQPVQQGIQRGDMKLELALRAGFDQFADFIAVARTALDDGKNDQLGRALLHFAL